MDITIPLGPITILSGQTIGEILFLPGGIPIRNGIIINAPTTLPETITMWVATRGPGGVADWKILRVGGADVTIVADRANYVPVHGIFGIRLVAGVAVAADRVFTLSATESA